MSEIEFVSGFFIKPPYEGAPDFVRATISIKVDEFVPWLKEKMAAKEEWINLDVKSSKKGSWYASVSTYKPKAKEAEKPMAPDPFNIDPLPF